MGRDNNIMGISGLSGQLLLQQKDFTEQYARVFTELRETMELLDVTLACEDDSLDAHKVVLSASSVFFRKVLSKTNQKHPFIYLKGIQFDDLKDILDFIYSGEVQIPAENIDRFLQAARELEIKGLAKNEVRENTQKHMDEDEVLKKENIFIKDMDELDGQDENNCQENSENDDSKDEECHVDEETKTKIEKEIVNHMEIIFLEGVKAFRCKVCAKICKKKANTSDHIEKHLDQTFPCMFCNRILKTRTALTKHIIYSDHIEESLDETSSSFKCRFCNKLMKTKTALNKHIIYNHATKREDALELKEENLNTFV